jgi:hypothetical protein
MSVLVKSWLVVIGTFCFEIAIVVRLHAGHGSVSLSGLLSFVSIVIAVALGERAYRFFRSSKEGGA